MSTSGEGSSVDDSSEGNDGANGQESDPGSEHGKLVPKGLHRGRTIRFPELIISCL